MELSKYDKVSVRFYWDNPMTIDQMTDLVYDFFYELKIYKDWQQSRSCW